MSTALAAAITKVITGDIVKRWTYRTQTMTLSLLPLPGPGAPGFNVPDAEVVIVSGLTFGTSWPIEAEAIMP